MFHYCMWPEYFLVAIIHCMMFARLLREKKVKDDVVA